MYVLNLNLRVAGREFKKGDKVRANAGKYKDGLDKKVIDELLKKEYVSDLSEEVEDDQSPSKDKAEKDSDGDNA